MNKIYTLPKENKGTGMDGGSMEGMFHVWRLKPKLQVEMMMKGWGEMRCTCKHSDV